MIFGTGGLAMTKLELAHSFSDNFASGGFPGAFAFGSASDRKIGWVAGGGFEWAFVRNWSFKTEYLFVNFGSLTANSTTTHLGLIGYSNALSTTGDLTAHIARAGVNFRF